MTDPQRYFREAERFERERAAQSRIAKLKSHSHGANRGLSHLRGYSREALPSGCMLYRLYAVDQPESGVVMP